MYYTNVCYLIMYILYNKDYYVWVYFFIIESWNSYEISRGYSKQTAVIDVNNCVIFRIAQEAWLRVIVQRIVWRLAGIYASKWVFLF